ncbi:MAG: flagellar motor switch protein FliG [Pseudomonadales bacterium]
MSDGKDEVGISKVDQAAILLMSLGEADAAAILKNMGPKEVQAIGTSMTTLENVQQEQVAAAASSLLQDVGGQTGLGVDSNDYIRNVMVKALGEDKANSLVDRIRLGGSSSGLETLKWMEARKVSDIIRHEHPQIQAIVIAYLEADQSAEILEFLPEPTRLEIIRRVAELDTVHPAALQELNEILEQQFAGYAKTQARPMGGRRIAAEILNSIDKKVEADVLEQLNEQNEELTGQIRDLMFVFENLLNVDDRGIQVVLREVDTDKLITALKGASEELKGKIFGNMSKRAAELLADDLDAKGPVRVSEVEEAQREILMQAQKLAEDGEISLGGSGDEML